MREILVKESKKPMIVDDADYEWLSRFSWHIDYLGYPVCKRGQIQRMLLPDVPKGMYRDHKNRNKLDNRRENLRVCTKAQNNQNRTRRKSAEWNTSKYRGVHCVEYGNNHKKWVAGIGVNGKHITIGTFTFQIQAARAYDEAAKKYHGEFAVLNFPLK